MTPEKPWCRPALLCVWLLCASVPAHPAVLDFLFGKKAADAEAPLDPKQRSWRLGEFTTVELVPREPDGADNQHPAQWPAEALRQQLALVRADLRGEPQPLFAADELGALAGPLSQALALAKPGDDVLLLSAHRRGSGILIAPFGITARLFVQDGNLQLIVHDARLDFVDTYIGTRVPPRFTFGSRVKAGQAALQSTAAVSRRADWLSIPAGPTAAAAANVTPATPSTPAVTLQAPVPAAPVPASAAPMATTKPAPAPLPSPAPALRPRDPGFAQEIEQRLLTLKRLLDKRLISEEEYQQKRKEVLQLL